MGELDLAIEALMANLLDFDLSPDSPVWKESSLELGKLLYQKASEDLGKIKAVEISPASEEILQKLQATLEQAIQQLGEVVIRYPDDHRIHQNRFWIAQSLRWAAEVNQLLVNTNPQQLDDVRRRRLQQRRHLLERSVAQFQSLLKSIQFNKDLTNSDSLDPAILRNCFFGAADSLSALGQYDEAIAAYRAIAGHYVNQPEALEALVQIAECSHKLGLEPEAKKAIRQAEQVLQRIPTEQDSRLVAYTRGDRKHWQELLVWMQQYQ
jgi:tetratricopeptide (TPR) repeat protein